MTRIQINRARITRITRNVHHESFHALCAIRAQSRRTKTKSVASTYTIVGVCRVIRITQGITFLYGHFDNLHLVSNVTVCLFNNKYFSNGCISFKILNSSASPSCHLLYIRVPAMGSPHVGLPGHTSCLYDIFPNLFSYYKIGFP